MEKLDAHTNSIELRCCINAGPIGNAASPASIWELNHNLRRIHREALLAKNFARLQRIVINYRGCGKLFPRKE